ncbi:MAG TPA: hypothetical protein V6C76_02105 [Drouetiella sp.]
MIDESILSRLRARNLFVSHPIPTLGGGVWVVKPESVPGNCIQGTRSGLNFFIDVPPCPNSDAPMLKLIHDKDKWLVDGWDCAGDMGSADFVNEWGTPEQALDDIFDFFFGNPDRVRAKESYQRKRKTEEPTKAD